MGNALDLSEGTLSKVEVAKILGVHVNTLARLRNGPPYFRVNQRGDRRYPVADLYRWIESRRV